MTMRMRTNPRMKRLAGTVLMTLLLSCRLHGQVVEQVIKSFTGKDGSKRFRIIKDNSNDKSPGQEQIRRILNP